MNNTNPNQQIIVNENSYFIVFNIKFEEFIAGRGNNIVLFQ